MTLKNAGSTRWSGLMLAVLLCAVSSPSVAATLYKWVDENGKIRYSDRLPPSQSKNGHQQLSPQGVVLSTKNAARTPEEMVIDAEAKRKLDEQQLEEARIKSIQAQQDRVLLLTFSTEQELEHASYNRMEVIDSVIHLIEASIGTTQEKLDTLQTKATNNYTSKGKNVPGGLAQKIEHFERKVENRNAQMERKKLEKEKIRHKYELDLERFRSLKSASN
jgi:hypothetical protein